MVLLTFAGAATSSPDVSALAGMQLDGRSSILPSKPLCITACSKYELTVLMAADKKPSLFRELL